MSNVATTTDPQDVSRTYSTVSDFFPATASTSAFSTVTVTVADEAAAEASDVIWEGVLAIEGLPTSDKRYLMPGKITERDLPLTLMAQTVTAEGHQGAEVAGKITEVWRVDRTDLGPNAVAIMGRGHFDSGEAGREAARMVEDETLRGVSIDLGMTEALMLDPISYEPIDPEGMDLMEMLTGDFVTGVAGEIQGATLTPFPAFAEATVAITAGGNAHYVAGFGIKVIRQVLTAAAAGLAPLLPPSEWFQDPHFRSAQALEITDEGRVYGHLALWGTCHTGIPGVCTTAPRSYSGYNVFHLGYVETEDNQAIACGQITLDTGHAPTSYGSEKTLAHYDDTGCAVADIICGEDRYGIWVAGAVRPGVKAETVRKLRGAKLSGDWRSVNGHLELIGVLAVNVPGFPVPRAQAAIAASAGEEGEVLALVAAGVLGDMGYRKRQRKKSMLAQRLVAALGVKPSPREQMRREAMAEPTAEERRKAADKGQAMPDGSFPIRDK